jgi:flavin-binding protein dodecin
MSSHTYRMVEIVGTSPQGIDDAIRNGVERANRTVRNLDWFQVTEIRGNLQEGQIADWQISMKVGFRLEDA